MPNWTPVARFNELEDGKGREVRVNGRPVALFREGSRVHALDDRCPHREGQLSDGWIKNGEAICPLHYWNFDLATGVSPYNPHDRVATYPVRVDNDTVYVDAEAVDPLPEATFQDYQARWKRWRQDARGHDFVRRLASGKGAAVEAMGSPLAGNLTGASVSGWDRYRLRPAQLARAPKLEDEAVSTETVIGPDAGRPLVISLPAFVSHMSFGALSREAKVALARGAAKAGTAIGSGEGGMLPDERKAAKRYVLEMASGYFGWTEEAIRQADAIEIKLGQSAKPGLGGELPGAKVTPEIARVRGIEPGTPAHSPGRFPDLASADDLRARVRELRELTGGSIPIGVKFAASRIEDVETALTLDIDFITLDGFGGGTGAAPSDVRDHFGLPLDRLLPEARRRVDAHNQRGERRVSLIATGTLRTPTDVMKALALGADACALATASLFALGCEYYRACNSGGCPVGIATQDPELRGRLNVETAAEQVAAFFAGTRRALETYLRVMGLSSTAELDGSYVERIEP
ncbi:glutamate synthase-related protein [Oceanithermus desulfurans]|uniref:Glutamate synthase n=2 Tax=Oceanithermus desulfurans TaxID=227924 RepID=A0A511RMC6_9DEIN|nr:glutamate synthase-related protein [Oceanithermus desulfurans]MBB6030991.1 glutamate synthase domain-containing protein 2/nitrite reductase/ring-hydroxylating ferredoxin subunit [Oceanithermus desulfurans]GEM90800.1 glutamate synthase [Oceanithermus desulfurans NBRC 100063]